MDLTQEDRQRIEQYADSKDRRLTSYHQGLMDGAEAATIYERQQQVELRNKVIDDIEVYCINLKKLAEWWNDDPTLIERISGGHAAINRVVEYLNSLKTK